MAEMYWNKQPYMNAFHAALKVSQEMDVRKLSSRKSTRWSDMCGSIAPITTVFYAYHGDKNETDPPLLNERLLEYHWGTCQKIDVILHGTIDRVTRDKVLWDTKTASAVGYAWKSDLRKRLLREPQMGMYDYLCRKNGIEVEGCKYELVVKSYKESEPRIEVLDVGDEVMECRPVWEQQLDWTIREMCGFYTECTQAEPWPMSNTACINQWGECDFLPVCSGKSSLENTKLYQIKEEAYGQNVGV